MLYKAQIIKVKDAWIPNKTIGFQISMNSDIELLDTLARKHQFKILLKERCEIDYFHRLVLTSMCQKKAS